MARKTVERRARLLGRARAELQDARDALARACALLVDAGRCQHEVHDIGLTDGFVGRTLDHLDGRIARADRRRE